MPSDSYSALLKHLEAVERIACAASFSDEESAEIIRGLRRAMQCLDSYDEG